MSVKRQDIVNVMNGWRGMNERDGSFKPIIDIYNTISPLPRGYKVKYTDAWCASAASAAYKQAGAEKIFPCECSCVYMVTNAKKMDIWIEDDGYTPKIADACLYDWQDNGIGDNTGTPDHVGIVVSVDTKSKTFVVMEGNKNNSVEPRTMSINGKYIRGFVSPIFDEDFVQPPTKVTESTKEDSSSNTTLGTGTISSIPAGTALNLNQTPMYASAATKSVSSYKTGVYYLWSVDTINNRVRITNTKARVGVAGQVTGWIDASVAISLTQNSNSNNSTSSNTPSASVPSYQVNAVYSLQVNDLVVRKGPGTNYDKVGYSGLTANAKKYDVNKNGCLCKGTKVTCLEAKTVGNNVWIRIPSGWIAAYYDKKYYVK